MTMLDVEARAALARADWYPAPAAERQTVTGATEFLKRVNGAIGVVSQPRRITTGINGYRRRWASFPLVLRVRPADTRLPSRASPRRPTRSARACARGRAVRPPSRRTADLITVLRSARTSERIASASGAGVGPAVASSSTWRQHSLNDCPAGPPLAHIAHSPAR